MARISQQKIAQALGVSQSLVSIVLNGRKDGISEETYNKIWRYAQEMGYTPKGMKVSLAGDGKPGLQAVGYFLRAPLSLANKSNFFSHVTQGLHEYLDEHQITTVFLGSESEFDKNPLGKVSWQANHLKGIIIMGEVRPAFLDSVRKLGKPVVYVSARAPGFCHSINSNEAQTGELLVDHLMELGHQNIAVIAGEHPKSRNDERRNAVERAMEARGLKLAPEAVITAKAGDPIDGFRCAEELLRRGLDPAPTAVVCVNGLMARGAINYFAQNGLKIGRDISVCCFDMTRVCTADHPSITSAAAIPEDLGRHAGKLIIERKPDEPMTDIVLPACFEARESTGPAPVQAKSRSA